MRVFALPGRNDAPPFDKGAFVRPPSAASLRIELAVSSKPRKIGGDGGEWRPRHKPARRQSDRVAAASRPSEREEIQEQRQSRRVPSFQARSAAGRALATCEYDWRTSLKFLSVQCNKPAQPG